MRGAGGSCPPSPPRYTSHLSTGFLKLVRASSLQYLRTREREHQPQPGFCHWAFSAIAHVRQAPPLGWGKIRATHFADDVSNGALLLLQFRPGFSAIGSQSIGWVLLRGPRPPMAGTPADIQPVRSPFEEDIDIMIAHHVVSEQGVGDPIRGIGRFGLS